MHRHSPERSTSRNTRTRLGEFTTLRTTAKIGELGGDLDEVVGGDRGDRGFHRSYPTMCPRRCAAPSRRLTRATARPRGQQLNG